MANFDAQIESLVGTGPTQDEYDQWLTDGAKELINILPEELLHKCMKTTTLNGDTPTLSSAESKSRILAVLREDADSDEIEQPCIRVSSENYGKVNDPYSIYYATYNTPVYVIHNNVLRVSPAPTNGQVASVCHVDYPSINADGGSSIANFPDEAEYLVVLYAAIKAAQSLLASEEDIELYGPIIQTLKEDYTKGLQALISPRGEEKNAN
jgi:hypothetical protein